MHWLQMTGCVLLIGLISRSLHAAPLPSDRQNVSRNELAEFMNRGGIIFPEDRRRSSELSESLAAIKAARVDLRTTQTIKRKLDDGTTVYTFPSQTMKDAAIASTNQQIAAWQLEMKKPEAKMPPLWFDLMKTGDVGRLRQMIADFELPSPDRSVQFRIVQITGPNAVIIASEHWMTRENLRALAEIKTEGILDDRDHDFGNAVFECVGTIETAFGKIWHLKQRSATELLKDPEPIGK